MKRYWYSILLAVSLVAATAVEYVPGAVRKLTPRSEAAAMERENGEGAAEETDMEAAAETAGETDWQRQRRSFLPRSRKRIMKRLHPGRPSQDPPRSREHLPVRQKPIRQRRKQKRREPLL